MSNNTPKKEINSAVLEIKEDNYIVAHQQKDKDHYIFSDKYPFLMINLHLKETPVHLLLQV
jgi:hypothetical protein